MTDTSSIISLQRQSEISPVTLASPAKKRPLFQGKDTLATVDQAIVISHSNHIELPKKAGSNNPEPAYLQELGRALEQTFEAMAKGTITLTNDLTNLQELNSTMSTIINNQTTQQVQQELKEVKVIQKIIDEQKHESLIGRVMTGISTFGLSELLNACGVSQSLQSRIFTDASTFGMSEILDASGVSGTTKLALTITIAVVCTVVLFAATAGASSLLSGAEATAGTAAVTSEATAGASAGVDATQIGNTARSAETISTLSTEAQTSTAEVSQSTRAADGSLDTGLVSDAQKRADLAAKIGKTLGRMVLGGVLGATHGVPEILMGCASLEIAHSREELAETQEQVGKSGAVISQNNAYFKFYEKLIQRTADASTEAGNELGDVVTTFSQITSAYQQLANNMAQIRA